MRPTNQQSHFETRAKEFGMTYAQYAAKYLKKPVKKKKGSKNDDDDENQL